MENNISSLVIPNTVTEIWESSFSTNLITTLTLPWNPNILANENVFYENKIKTLNIPNWVTIIWIWAFAQNYTITWVTIPNTVTTINDRAFDRNNLTSINIPSSVKTIWYRAFSCNKLSSVTVWTGITSIWSRVFWHLYWAEACDDDSLIVNLSWWTVYWPSIWYIKTVYDTNKTNPWLPWDWWPNAFDVNTLSNYVTY
jgi:hypothetical protein